MIIKEKKNFIELSNESFPFFNNVIFFFVNIVVGEPRRWAFFVYLFFIFSPSNLQASSLPFWDVGNDRLDASSLITEQLNESILGATFFVKPPSVNVENRFSLNKWFSEIIGEVKEIILLIPDFLKNMAKEIYNEGPNKTEEKDDYIFGFHKYFLLGFLSGIIGMFIHSAQQLGYMENFPYIALISWIIFHIY